MTLIAEELEDLLTAYLPQLTLLIDEKSAYKSSPSKWSNKELIGHLIDSAQNNIRRFIVAQYEHNPTILYKQDDWVANNNYNKWNINDLIQLWLLLNRQLAYILKNISLEGAQRITNTNESHTIEWLAKDYLLHLKYHLHQVLNLAPEIY